MRFSLVALILLLIFWSTTLHGADFVTGLAVGELVGAVVATAVFTSVVSGLVGSWITVHVLRERLSGIERWLRSVNAEVKQIKRDLYRPVIPGAAPSRDFSDFEG